MKFGCEMHSRIPLSRNLLARCMCGYTRKTTSRLSCFVDCLRNKHIFHLHHTQYRSHTVRDCVTHLLLFFGEQVIIINATVVFYNNWRTRCQFVFVYFPCKTWKMLRCRAPHRTQFQHTNCVWFLISSSAVARRSQPTNCCNCIRRTNSISDRWWRKDTDKWICARIPRANSGARTNTSTYGRRSTSRLSVSEGLIEELTLTAHANMGTEQQHHHRLAATSDGSIIVATMHAADSKFEKKRDKTNGHPAQANTKWNKAIKWLIIFSIRFWLRKDLSRTLATKIPF